MTAKELLARLTEIRDRNSGDPEADHWDADQALIRYAMSNNSGPLADEIAERFEQIKRWYA